MNFQVEIRKGNVKTSNNLDNCDKESIAIYNRNISENNIANDDSEIMAFVRMCKNAVKTKVISTRSASITIVGKIRNIYCTTCVKHGDNFDIEALNYMDKILFDNLANFIEGVIKYGPMSIKSNLIKEYIKDCIESIEYETNINKIYEVIDAVYTIF